MIRVPDWVADKRGTFYMYFAHHKGTYIYMAFADKLSGETAMMSLLSTDTLRAMESLQTGCAARVSCAKQDASLRAYCVT